jgi:hypothetical protein
VQPIGERIAFDQLQHLELRVAVGQLVDGGGVGMVERGHSLRLAVKASDPFRIARVRFEDLDGDLTVESCVLGSIDLAF